MFYKIQKGWNEIFEVTTYLDRRRALAKTVASVIVYHNINTIVYVEVEEVWLVLDLLGVHGVRATEYHCCRLCSILFINLSAWNPITVNALVVMRTKKDGLGLRVAKLHLGAQLLECSKNL